MASEAASGGTTAAETQGSQLRSLLVHEQLPELQLIYDTAPVGLAFLTPDCRYLQVNQRLTEICQIPVADHVGRSVRETVPQVADAVESIVQTVLRTGQPVLSVEINGQHPATSLRVWNTDWHPLKRPDGSIAGINVVAEEITERKRAEAELAATARSLRESESRFRELADNISQFAWTADAAGWIYWYNKPWYDYTGTTLEDMQGWGWQKVHHPDYVERVVRLIRQCFETGTVWEDTFPLRARDGSYRWFLSRALPIRDEAGEVIRWFGTNTDVTEQIEAEQALRDLNETLELRVEAETRERLQVWNVSQDLLVVAERQGNYLSVNPAWTTMLGWSEAELLGKRSWWLLHPDDRERTFMEIKRLNAGETMQRFENRFRHKDGSYRWLSWKAVPDRGRIYAMGRDVTDLKLAEHALQEVGRDLARVTGQTALATMTASIAHEINQPLAAIVTNGTVGLRWLDRERPELDEVRNVLKRIVSDGHRASDVVASIRGLFRKDTHEKLWIDLNELLRQVLALVQGEMENQQIVPQLQLLESLPLIMAERVPLQQVVLNLVTNAIEAMSAVEGRSRLLKIRTQRQGSDAILMTVSDSGIGIDPKIVDRIFEPFFTTKEQGMGIGLSICRSIVENQGGQLWASNGSPHGAVFHLQLPVGGSSD